MQHTQQNPCQPWRGQQLQICRSPEGQEERKGSTGVHEEKIMGLSEYKPARSELQYRDNPLTKPATALERKFKVG
jgi:hypothetical protein